MYTRQHVSLLRQRLDEPRKFIQVLTGPRQVGKTTIIRHALEGAQVPITAVSADELVSPNYSWVEAKWQEARMKTDGAIGILAIDEIQKVPNWSSIIKKLWDEDTASNMDLRVVLSGSSTTVIHSGLNESLAGRFERIRVMPWSFNEMQEAFGWNLDTYLNYGGYPGPAEFVSTPLRWFEYMRESIIEPVIAKDVLHMHRIDKPFLMRQLAEISARLSSKEVSYTKLLGQFHDAGNSTTLAHYLQLLEEAGMISCLPKFTRHIVRQRRSTPKLQVFANAIATASGAPWVNSNEPTHRGQLVESAVGAHLRCSIEGTDIKLSWWREGNNEVDFVLHDANRILGIEVASGSSHHYKGLDAFRNSFPEAQTLMIGASGMPLEDALRHSATELLTG